jgi:hypothetical protein
VVLVSSLNEDSLGLGDRIHPSRLAEIPESMDRPQPQQVIRSPPSPSRRRGASRERRAIRQIATVAAGVR